MKKKVSLVLEGGGMRGAYTAGCLSWLIDEGIDFSNAYGISTGAVHLCSYLLKDKTYLHNLSVREIVSREVIGLRSILREGQIVGYDYLFKQIMEDKYNYDVKNIVSDINGYIGLYDLNISKTEYHHVKDIDNDMLKAACSLPIIGRIVKKGEKLLLDGGILEMIPIEQAIRDENDVHLVITTKPLGYVRKPSNAFVVWLMSRYYRKHPQIAKDYQKRPLNYRKEIDIIKTLEKEGKAFYRYPTKTINVSRLRGKPEDLEELYQLGYQDMENSREAIYKLLVSE